MKNIIVLLVLMTTAVWSQEPKLISSQAVSAEKIYLQLDRNLYTTTDTIWFKSILLNASQHTPSTLSGVLHVELIQEDETLYKKQLIKLENGIGEGYFVLNKNASEGKYLVRAYTRWNENFENDFFFEEYIYIFGADDKGVDPIENISLIEDEENNRHLQVHFNPKAIDSSHRNKLTVFITLDDKKDTLALGKGKNENYSLDYSVDEKTQFATFKIQTDNNKIREKTVILNKEYIDLQFFPESGKLIHGLSGKVGFKALDANGNGKPVEGVILDEKQNFITPFKSNSLGMGYFFINEADSTKNYFARLNTSALKGEAVLHPLPKVASKGTSLSVIKQGENVLIKTASNFLKNEKIFLQVSMRGVNLYKQEANLEQGAHQMLMAVNPLPEGIIVIKLLDKQKKPIAERLYFNEKRNNRLQIDLSADKQVYNKRELTSLTIKTKKDEKALKTNLSLLVIDKKKLGSAQTLRQNILSYFLVDSELKGTVENPGYYFKSDSSKYFDLEALILTQGWSNYTYAQVYESFINKPETALSVSGKVNTLFSNKKGKENIELTMITSGKTKSIYTQVSDSLGNFDFRLKDEYGGKMEVIVQTTGKSGAKKNNPVSFFKRESPPVTFEHDNSVYELDSIVTVFVEESKKQRKMEQEFEMQNGSVLLDEVNLSAYKMTPNRKKVMERFGKPEVVIDGKEILSKKQTWSYGLFSILMHEYPGIVNIRPGNEGYLQANINNDSTLFVVDGIPVQYVDFSLIPNIPPEEITSMEIIYFARDFQDLYCSVHPEILECRMAPPIWGHVIALYTKAQIGIHGARKPDGLTPNIVDVFASPREFYVPKYDNKQNNTWKSLDLRTVINWKPILQTNESGELMTSFYNADVEGEMMVVVEALSDEGEIGYQEITYEVTQHSD
ncbi:MG2 domain-containing protein [Leeuwenhoekiella parthenopeia]|uniref:Macroglobulin domain-containing protein n=1 Tax=Leeuwenhoekiella parthenopeia TaxID=2890320 RepID=A0ABS8GNF3_9FLAO|nr:MG2 domain-containing protein [Leeuwenhoekiella parthenopeia]MCC4211210.1 hypothetical protein [Leeuwenhoekiella parthenopeia]